MRNFINFINLLQIDIRLFDILRKSLDTLSRFVQNICFLAECKSNELLTEFLVFFTIELSNLSASSAYMNNIHSHPMAEW